MFVGLWPVFGSKGLALFLDAAFVLNHLFLGGMDEYSPVESSHICCVYTIDNELDILTSPPSVFIGVFIVFQLCHVWGWMFFVM